MSTEVDARGMDCPQPVIATKRALDSLTDGVMTTIVDNAVAKENVVKFAVANQCGVSVEEKNGHYYIRITKDASVVRPVDEPAPAAPGRVVYLITNNTLGHGSEELGHLLDLFLRVIEAGDEERHHLHPEPHLMEMSDRIGDVIQNTAQGPIGLIAEALEIDLIEINPGPEIVQDFRRSIPV